MCGRFTLTVLPLDWATLIGAEPPPDFAARCNIAPAQKILTLRRTAGDAQARFAYLQWGLIPSWAKDAKIGSRLINARAETIADKPAFRAALKHRRCLILADGFYEWKTVGGRKQPHHFRRRDHGPFAFAGLWESWQDPAGKTRETCMIVTTTANELLAPFHERMPAILDPADGARWLDPETSDPALLLPLLRPYPAKKMTETPVNERVNNSRYEGPDCLD